MPEIIQLKIKLITWWVSIVTTVHYDATILPASWTSAHYSYIELFVALLWCQDPTLLICWCICQVYKDKEKITMFEGLDLLMDKLEMSLQDLSVVLPSSCRKCKL